VTQSRDTVSLQGDTLKIPDIDKITAKSTILASTQGRPITRETAVF